MKQVSSKNQKVPRDNRNSYKNNYDWGSTGVTLAFVVRGTTEELNEICRYLRGFKNIYIVYSKISPKHLWVVEQDPRREDR